MVLDERSLEYEPLNEDYISRASSIGKLLMVANGTADDVTILIGEYGGLDDLAYQSIMNVVNILQPKGWEEFAANYTDLADAQEEGYTVTLDADEKLVDEIIDEKREGDSYALIHFGA